jgi:uncharacterized surface protein with fasciclin (FAS1) repeats
MNMTRYPLYLLLLAAVLAAGCVRTDDQLKPSPAESRSITTIIKNNYAFSLFYQALQRTGLDRLLDTAAGPFTLLAPDNDAFSLAGITADSLSRVDTATLGPWIRYHVILQNVPSASIPQTIDFTYPTLAGKPVYFSQALPIPGQHQNPSPGHLVIHVDGVGITKADIFAANGVIYDMVKPLTYPSYATVKDFLEHTSRYSKLTQALRQFGLLDKLAQPGPFVLLAPDNDVFDAHGIDDATLATMDSTHYKGMLFTTNIMTPNFFFVTDLADAPAPAGPLLNIPLYPTPDGMLTIGTSGIALLPFNYPELNYAGENIYIYGEQADITDPDHLTGNGLVQGIDAFIVLPDNVKK